MARGRPALTMTRRRHQVLRYLVDKALRREEVRLRQLVRDCGLNDNSAALRIMRDLETMHANDDLITPPAA